MGANASTEGQRDRRLLTLVIAVLVLVVAACSAAETGGSDTTEAEPAAGPTAVTEADSAGDDAGGDISAGTDLEGDPAGSFPALAETDTEFELMSLDQALAEPPAVFNLDLVDVGTLSDPSGVDVDFEYLAGTLPAEDGRASLAATDGLLWQSQTREDGSVLALWSRGGFAWHVDVLPGVSGLVHQVLVDDAAELPFSWVVSTDGVWRADSGGYEPVGVDAPSEVAGLVASTHSMLLPTDDALFVSTATYYQLPIEEILGVTVDPSRGRVGFYPSDRRDPDSDRYVLVVFDFESSGAPTEIEVEAVTDLDRVVLVDPDTGDELHEFSAIDGLDAEATLAVITGQRPYEDVTFGEIVDGVVVPLDLPAAGRLASSPDGVVVTAQPAGVTGWGGPVDVWQSPDGRDWTVETIDPEDLGGRADSAMWINVHDGLLAASVEPADGEGNNPLTWLRPTGGDWLASPANDIPDTWVDGFTRTDIGWIAHGMADDTRPNRGTHLVAWVSADLVDWTPIDLDPLEIRAEPFGAGSAGFSSLGGNRFVFRVQEAESGHTELWSLTIRDS